MMEFKEQNGDLSFKTFKERVKKLNNYSVLEMGRSIEFLKQYLESKFEAGMPWDNYGKYGWHIDYIIPLCKFDLANREELLKACHYTNLQPLWAKDNLNKGARTL